MSSAALAQSKINQTEIKFLIKSGQFKTLKITLCKVKSESLHMTCRLSTAVLAFENYKAVMTLW